MDRNAFLRRLAAQGGVCAICHTVDTAKRPWHIDHDHACCPGIRSCGLCVRAILCGHCNTGIGQMRDDPERMISAAEYILSFQDVLAPHEHLLESTVTHGW